MRAVLRVLLIVTALFSSGAMQVFAAVSDDACCPDETPAQQDCPPGAACACCPVRPSLPLVAPDVRPMDAAARTFVLSAPEPVVSARQSDIFHPPRA